MELVDRFLKKKFVIVPGFLYENDGENTKRYIDLIKATLLTYEVEEKFSIDFLLETNKDDIKLHLESINEPFIILLLREVSPSNFKFFEKFAKRKNCLIYYEGKRDNIAYFEEEKISKRIIFFEEKLELFLMLTKKELDTLAQKGLEMEKIEN